LNAYYHMAWLRLGSRHFAIFDSLPTLDLTGKHYDPFPLGPVNEVLHGKLSNGLTYYIRQANKPQNRAAIALAVKIGSAAEEETERGVAHILEHLAFNATEVRKSPCRCFLPCR